MHGHRAIVLLQPHISTADCGPPREQVQNDAVCMHVRVVFVCMRVRGTKKHHIFDGALSKNRNEWNKWKNQFYEMKGDVGMSLHEKERNKNMPIFTHQYT